MKITAQKIKEILLAQSYITQEDIDNSITRGYKDIREYLLSNNLLTKELLGEAIAEHYKILYVNLDSRVVPRDTINTLPMELIEQYEVVFLGMNRDIAELVTADPERIPELQIAFSKFFEGKQVRIGYALEEDFERFVSKYKKSLQERFNQIITDESASVPKVFNEIIGEAYNMRTSDIHIEPRNDQTVLIRYRVDGQLKEISSISHEMYEKILNRIKVLAKMKLDEHFAPQDGSIRLDTDKYSLVFVFQ